jgi:hypothetical protein
LARGFILGSFQARILAVRDLRPEGGGRRVLN